MSGAPSKKGLIESPGDGRSRQMPFRDDRARRRRGRSGAAAPLLTSLIDVLLILVVFLAQEYVPSGELLCSCKRIVVPEAINALEIERAEVIGVSDHAVTLGGRPVADVSLLRADQDDWRIEDLHDQLVTLKNDYKLLHPSEPFPGTVIVEADRAIDYRVLKKVLYTCAIAGYAHVRFAVNQVAVRHG